MAIISRLMLYIVIPPLAWPGAACVEITLEAFLSGTWTASHNHSAPFSFFPGLEFQAVEPY
jgi:hypothetical protein